MSESQRLQLYAIIFTGTIALFTFFNFQRYSELKSKRIRMQNSLVNCEDLQSEFADLAAIPSDFPFVHTEPAGIQTLVRERLMSAGIANQSIQSIREETVEIAESGYLQNTITISFRSELTIDQIMSSLSRTEANTSDDQTLAFWVQTVDLVDSDGKPSTQGSVETWKCRKLILSCLIKPDKSP